jgi:hypothetical protein
MSVYNTGLLNEDLHRGKNCAKISYLVLQKRAPCLNIRAGRSLKKNVL